MTWRCSARTDAFGFGSLQSAASAGELAGSLGRATEDGGDFLEGDGEHVVENEGQTLGWRQTIEHDEECETDRIGQESLLLRVGSGLPWRGGFGLVIGETLFAAGLTRPQHIETDAGDDGGQPSTEIGDGSGIGTAEAEPRFLNGVIGLAKRSEHAVGDGSEVIAILFKSFGQPSGFVHFFHLIGPRSHSCIAIRHGSDEGISAFVTRRQISCKHE
jgi:hypothetical protein